MSLHPEPPREVRPSYPTLAPSRVHVEPTASQWWRPLLNWWYSISAPVDVLDSASLEKREIVRRGRVASLILPVIIALVILPIPTAFGNPILLSTLILVLSLDVVALFGLNRSGHVTAAGILVVIGVELGLGVSVLTYPGGFGPSTLPLFDLMVQSLVVAVAMLAPSIVFLVAVINGIFIVAVLHSNILTPDLAKLVTTDTGRIIIQPITLQIAIAWLTFVLLRSTNQAIRRADRAEELAVLAQQNLELQQRELERTRQIEQGIEQILAAMVRFANGDSSVRAPESQDNVLWKIGRSLNNLLARLKDYHRKSVELEQARKEIASLYNSFQSSASAQNELQRTREASARLKEAIKQAKSKGTLLAVPVRSGTIVDEIAVELRTIQIQQDFHNLR